MDFIPLFSHRRCSIANTLDQSQSFGTVLSVLNLTIMGKLEMTKRKPGTPAKKLYSVNGGEPKTIAELADAFQISKTVLRTRLGYGWDIEHALLRPARKNRKIGDLTVCGTTRTFAQWSTITGIAESILRNRVWLGWDPVDVINQPVKQRAKRKAN